ncbi:MAG: SH3 domain-containing protein [Pseudomonadota bacterium]
MRKTKLLFASVSALAASAFVFSASAQAAEEEFQCSSGYRIALPALDSNGVIQTSNMFDRMIFEAEGLWFHDDTNIAFRLSGEAAILDVDGSEIACQKVAQAFVTTTVEPASARALPLEADKAQVAAVVPQGGTPKSGRVSAVGQETEQAGLNSSAPLVPAVGETPTPAVPTGAASQSVTIVAEGQVASLPTGVDTETTGSLELAPETPSDAVEEVETILTGQSRGGRLRAGPGTDFAIAGAIETGTPVKILENVGNTFRGFDWFEIEYGDGQRAFTWGGILCSDGEKTDGIFEVCG